MRGLRGILCLFVMLLLWACADGDKPEPTGNRTVLVYMSAENSLDGFVKDDLKEMQEGAKSLPDGMHLIVFLDITNTNSKLYRIDRSGMKEIKDYGEDLVSTDVFVLKRVLGDVEWKFPATEYGMVMWSHATGWQDYPLMAASAVSRSFGQDTNSGTLAPQLNVPDMAEALKSFPKFRYIMFDACFMQCIEVAYELKNVTDYILGAPCEIPGTGAYYDKLVPAMFSSSFVRDLVDNYYQPYIAENTADPSEGYGAVMAALDCSQVDNFTAVTREVLPQYDATKPFSITSLQPYLSYDSYASRNFSISPYYDIKGQMQQLLSAPDFMKWEDALNRLIVAKGATQTFFSAYAKPDVRVDKDKFSGLAGYVPNVYPGCERWDELFRKTGWYEAAGWAEKGW